ncbi:MAG TPA: hypothetical protein ENO03_05705 [Candidatus Aminicenantes bacterium]|nr:hypothetical protein [Candidatus Aminicenantes bacterium]
MDPREDIRKHLKPVTIVAWGIFASLAIYLGLVTALRSARRPFGGFAGDVGGQPLRLAVFGLAAAVIMLILVLRHRLFRKGGREDRSAVLARLQRASLAVLLLGEIPAVLGLALFLLGGYVADFYALLIASLALTFIDFPRQPVWEEWLRG